MDEERKDRYEDTREAFDEIEAKIKAAQEGVSESPSGYDTVIEDDTKEPSGEEVVIESQIGDAFQTGARFYKRPYSGG